MDKLFKHIIESNTESFIFEKLDEYIPEYISDWEDDFDDIHEAYEEQGRGEAESQILGEVIIQGMKTLDMKLNSDEHCDLFDALAEHWNLLSN